MLPKKWVPIATLLLFTACSQLREVGTTSGALSLNERAAILQQQSVFSPPSETKNPPSPPQPTEGVTFISTRLKRICSTSTSFVVGASLWNSAEVRMVLKPSSRSRPLDSEWKKMPLIEEGAALREQIMSAKTLQIPLSGYAGLSVGLKYEIALYIPGAKTGTAYGVNPFFQGKAPLFIAKSPTEISPLQYSTVTPVVVGWNPEVPSPGPEVPPSQIPPPEKCDEKSSPLAIKLNEKEPFHFGLFAPFDLYGPFTSGLDVLHREFSWGTDVHWLALPNAQGEVNGIRELFGNLTPVEGPTGVEPAGDGYLALARYDHNHDRLIDAADPVFSSLRLWRDKNSNGRSDPDELISLSDAGIRAIELNVDTNYSEIDPSSGVEAIGKTIVHMRDKTFRVMTDLWLTPRKI